MVDIYMSDMEQKVEAPVKIKTPMDENRIAQLAATGYGNLRSSLVGTSTGAP